MTVLLVLAAVVIVILSFALILVVDALIGGQRAHRSGRHPAGFRFSISGGVIAMKSNEQQTLSIVEEDAAGNPISAEVGSAVWSNSDGAVIELVVADDGFSATARAVGPTGASTVQATVTIPASTDGDPDRVFQGSIALQVEAADVEQIAIVASDPTPQG